MNGTDRFTIGQKKVGTGQPVYFIADIASSHDGELSRAVDLIYLAAEAGADCAKFQHFLAKDIVSDVGFVALGQQGSHQAAWKQSVFEVFEKYQTPRNWTTELVAACKKAGVDYMTTPYDAEALALMDPFVGAYKIGSGDIACTDFLADVARRKKPVFLATGAATITDVKRSVSAILAHTNQICLMQCNTNYTGELNNFNYINLKVLQTYAKLFPEMILGLSDHTPGHATTLGAVALGAKAVEKHFTDDNTRDGPDHGFSMNPASWREMVERTRELERALGDGIKRVEGNEQQAAIVQRRALRLTTDLPAGHLLCAADIEALRPKPVGAIEPWQQSQMIGRTLPRAFKKGEALMDKDFP
ncbi:N,N'-diacetyllegionaminic acid synthase [hydrothermal vent metagenome]|uniref:N,N'-diacetyllegionaminic acid synthase n=1 Tax=hydrothermal vent metagenome TaxID=652676 RepID=A0A3B0S7C0_9ZZZZ